MNVPFLVSNILSGVGMLAMLASTALRSRKKILAVQSVNPALSMAAKPPRGLLNGLDKKAGFSLASPFIEK